MSYTTPNILAGFAVSLVLSLMTVFALCNNFTKKINRLEADLKYYHDTYKTRSGGVLMDAKNHTYVNYNWVSVDGGKTWFNRDDMTPADPAVLKTVQAWDALTTAVERKGSPLDVSNPADQKVLTDAGFEIVKK